MIKFNLFFACALILTNLCAIGVNAQTKIWGAGTSNDPANGEFQNAFIQTGTTGSYAINAWTALSINESLGAVTPGNAYWVRNLTGYSAGAYAGTTPMPSPSQSNGVAIFDSDFLDNAGTAGAFGTGTSPAGHRGELISPQIDLSGYTNTPLVVQFFSEYREFQINELSVSMSTDDGVTWSTPVDYRVLQSSSSPGIVRVLMPDVTNGINILDQCRVRFVFDNNYYYAMIDDVTIETAPQYDIAMGNADPNGSLLVDNGDFVKIGGNRYQALSNLDPTNLKEWFWGGKVVNYGAQDILPQGNAKMHVSIDFYDAITNALTPAVYLDSMELGTVYGGGAIDSVHIEYLEDINFITTNGKGDYRVKYWVTHDSIDGLATNDTAYHTFTITGTITSYISKARRAASDGRVFASRGIFPGGGPFSAFEYGSVYYFPKGTTNSLAIDSIEFRYQVPGGYTGPAIQTLFVKVYRLVDGSGSAASNGVLDGDELTEVGLGVASLSGLGTTVAAGSYGLGVVSSLVDPLGNPMGGLDDHGLYYISLAQQPSLTGGAATFTSTTGLWYGADEYNYYMNAAMTLTDTIINPSPSSTTDAAGATNWFWTGFGADLVPSIGIHLAPCPLSTNNPIIEIGENMGLSVFPNPVSTNLNFTVEFEGARDVRYILTDVSGRVLLMFNSDNVTEETKSINIEKFPTGIYFLTAETEKGSKTERIIKK